MRTKISFQIFIMLLLFGCESGKFTDDWINIEYESDKQLIDLGFFKEKVSLGFDTIGYPKSLETGALVKLYHDIDTFVRFRKISDDSVEKQVHISTKHTGSQLWFIGDTLRILSGIRNDIFSVKKEGFEWFLYDKNQKIKRFEALVFRQRIILVKTDKIR